MAEVGLDFELRFGKQGLFLRLALLRLWWAWGVNNSVASARTSQSKSSFRDTRFDPDTKTEPIV